MVSSKSVIAGVVGQRMVIRDVMVSEQYRWQENQLYVSNVMIQVE